MSSDGLPGSTPDYEELPVTGARPRRAPRMFGETPRFRWGAVIAGLFFAFGVEVLLGLLGLAIGASVIGPHAGFAGVSFGTGIWMGIVALLAVFVGGFASARLGGASRRGDGSVAGALTWAVALAAGAILFGATPSTTLMESSSLDNAGAKIVHVDDELGPAVRMPSDAPAARLPLDVRLWAWGGFVGALASLCAGVAGGILGVRAPRSDEEIPA